MIIQTFQGPFLIKKAISSLIEIWYYLSTYVYVDACPNWIGVHLVSNKIENTSWSKVYIPQSNRQQLQTDVTLPGWFYGDYVLEKVRFYKFLCYFLRNLSDLSCHLDGKTVIEIQTQDNALRKNWAVCKISLTRSFVNELLNLLPQISIPVISHSIYRDKICLLFLLINWTRLERNVIFHWDVHTLESVWCRLYNKLCIA